jgi:hypothetical protein
MVYSNIMHHMQKQRVIDKEKIQSWISRFNHLSIELLCIVYPDGMHRNYEPFLSIVDHLWPTGNCV